MNEVLTITYTNYRGETSVRRIRPMTLYYGGSDWHKGLQWILLARDLDKDEVREFALKDFGVPATARDDALEEAKQVAIRRRKEAMKSAHPDSIIREDEAEEIALAIEALKGSKP